MNDVVPSTSTSALATIRSDGLLVVAPEDLDDVTLRKLVFLTERLKRRRHRALALCLGVPYSLLMLGGLHPLLAIPGLLLAIVGTGVGMSISRVHRRGYLQEARDLGIAPEVATEIERRVRKSSSTLPRWVTGQKRIRAMARQVKGQSLDDGALE